MSVALRCHTTMNISHGDLCAILTEQFTGYSRMLGGLEVTQVTAREGAGFDLVFAPKPEPEQSDAR